MSWIGGGLLVGCAWVGRLLVGWVCLGVLLGGFGCLVLLSNVVLVVGDGLFGDFSFAFLSRI